MYTEAPPSYYPQAQQPVSYMLLYLTCFYMHKLHDGMHACMNGFLKLLLSYSKKFYFNYWVLVKLNPQLAGFIMPPCNIQWSLPVGNTYLMIWTHIKESRPRLLSTNVHMVPLYMQPQSTLWSMQPCYSDKTIRQTPRLPTIINSYPAGLSTTVQVYVYTLLSTGHACANANWAAFI